MTKVKGVIFTNYSDEELAVPNYPELYRRIWDPSDYVSPDSGLEHGGFFIMTNVVVTPNQTRGICPEVKFLINKYIHWFNITSLIRQEYI